MIGKEKLSFDPTDADTLAASDSVGAYLRAGTDGELLDSTSGALHVSDGGGSLTVDATDLDIRALTQTDEITVFQGTDPWVVSATDLDIRNLSASQDNVAISDGTDTLAINADGSINIATSSPLTVQATDFDIRDLAFATDKVDVTGSEVSLDAATLAALETITVNQGTSPWVVSATDLDIRDLTAASDSVASHLFDGTGNAITSTGGALDINIASSDIEIDVEDDKANTAILNTQEDVTTTSAALLASQLADRKFLYVQNLGNRNIFIGASGVTTGTGIRMSAGSIAEFRLGPALSLHAVAQAGTQDIRLMELS